MGGGRLRRLPLITYQFYMSKYKIVTSNKDE